PLLYLLSLHDALPISGNGFGITAGEIDQRREIAFVHPLGDLLQLGAFLPRFSRHLAPKPNRCVCTSMTGNFARAVGCSATCSMRSEEHTSELQSRFDL